VVLGGTGQVGNAVTSMSLADADKIAERALQVVPSLAHAEVLDHWVGLRPGRCVLS
jgi:glycine/D-amino acid oxidase-like deaminating enzyme